MDKRWLKTDHASDLSNLVFMYLPGKYASQHSMFVDVRRRPSNEITVLGALSHRELASGGLMDQTWTAQIQAVRMVMGARREVRTCAALRMRSE